MRNAALRAVEVEQDDRARFGEVKAEVTDEMTQQLRDDSAMFREAMGEMDDSVWPGLKAALETDDLAGWQIIREQWLRYTEQCAQALAGDEASTRWTEERGAA